ncbi:putative 26S proteasome regulatory subunit p27 [Smittium culicis]|uniref:Probable 26S proteasome regulatory subunit p27 n=1 Tax=Smittium culicis TaxID=133412 RepID=A0A1R1XW81_9FUNG|nr:putative 26S proteasome regulatory subunit p27 [Smittium culicis]
MSPEDSAMEATKSLLHEKTALESRILTLESSLKNIGVDVDTSLIDSEGFPRADIDIVSARKLRSEINMYPFCQIGVVSPNSPSSKGELQGILPGDKIVEFGNINCKNFKSLAMISKAAQDNLENSINVSVERVENGNITTLNLTLTPEYGWGGSGILGCSFNVL